MTLEDFFTLTEMKDGLATLSRVEELVSVMQKEKDNAVMNIGDAARQWSTVAGVLAATENKGCLNHFIQLDGLRFLNQWLQEGQKCSSDTIENFVEESVEFLLAALEKLPVGNREVTAYGIRATVGCFIGHKVFKVQEMAKSLVNRWNLVDDKDIQCQELVEKSCSSSDEHPQSSAMAKMALNGKGDESGTSLDQPGNITQSSNITRSSDVSEAAAIKDVAFTYNHGSEADVNAFLEGGCSRGFSFVPNCSQKTLVVVEEPSRCTAEDVSCNSQISWGRTADDGSSDVSDLKDGINGKEMMEIDMNLKEGFPHKLRKREKCSVAEALVAEESGSILNCNSSSDCSHEQKILEPQLKTGALDVVITEHSNNVMELKHVGHVTDSYPKISLDSSSSATFGNMSDTKEIACLAALKGTRVMDSMLSETKKSKLREDNVDMMDRTKSKMEFSVEDVLEVSQLVAKEVEQEVDYSEPSCCSSGKNSKGETALPDSIFSADGKQDEPSMDHLTPNASLIKREISEEAGSSPMVKRLTIFNRAEVEPEAGIYDLKSTPSTGMNDGSVGNTDKSKCDFDLNEDVATEEMECSLVFISNQPNSTLSAPIPVIATSKGVPGFPVNARHFVGELGWRGSTARSAFRPASPRRTSDGEIFYLGETNSKILKQKQNFFKIDLNVAEGEEPGIDVGSAIQAPRSSGLPSGESSIEVSSKKVGRLQLDLNRVDDHEEVNPFSLSYPMVGGRLFNQLHQNGNQSASPASSSSSMQPSVRDFDLNDNLSLIDVCGSRDLRSDFYRPSSQEKSYGGSRREALSLIGSRMEVQRKDFITQTHSFLSNELGADPSLAGMRPTTLAYAPPPPALFGYNGLTMGPSTSLPPHMYGPTSVPYMVDSRGTTLIPQIAGSAPDAAPPYSRPPYLTSMMGPASVMNPNGAPLFGVDLNSAMTSMDNESQEMRDLRHQFLRGHGSEPMMPGLQLGGTGLSLKRKEPECGWELNLVGYRPEASWHRH